MKRTTNLTKPIFFVLTIVMATTAWSADVFINDKVFAEHFVSGKSFESNRVQLGAPPISQNGSKLILNAGYTNDIYDFGSENESLRTFSFIPVFLQNIGANWKLAAVTPISFSSGENMEPISSETLTFVPSLQLNRYSGRKENNFGFGFVVIKQANKTQLFPSFSFRWVNQSNNLLLSAGFPKIEICRRIGEKTSICGNSSVELATSAIDSNAEYARDSDYLNIQRFKAGVDLTTSLLGNLYASVSIGKVLNEIIIVTDEDLKKNASVKRADAEDLYTSAKLSLKF